MKTTISLIFILFSAVTYASTNQYLYDNNEIYIGFEESSSPILDANPNSTDATCLDCPAFDQAGIFNNATHFDGNNDKFQLDANSIVDCGTSDFTINLWVKLDQLTDKREILGQWSNTPSINLDFRGDQDNKVLWQLYGSSSVRCDLTSQTNAISDTNWHMLTAIKNGAITELWIDGVNSTPSSTDYTGCGSVSFDEDQIYLGNTITAERHFEGLLDEFSYYSAVLNSTHIAYLYSSGSPAEIQVYPFGISQEINLSNIVCISDEGYAEPYYISDLTPTFVFETSVGAVCKFSDSDLGYNDMTHNCNTTDFSLYHSCTLNVNDSLSGTGTDYVYVACNNGATVHNSSTNRDIEIFKLSANESSVQPSILAGITQSAIWPGATIYYDQQVYLRSLTGTNLLETVDAVATYGNQRWLFHYTNTTKIGLFNLSPVVYSLDMVNITAGEIQLKVRNLIDSTKN